MIGILQKEYPDVRCTLDFRNDFELFVAVCLSANCSDAMVNRVTPGLFSGISSFRELSKADVREIEKRIRSLGLYKSKSRNLKKASKMILEKHCGEIPKDMKELMELPGVGRKIANVLLATAHGIMDGIAVDTHVARLSRRLGLTESENRSAIEKDLMKTIPRSLWDRFSLMLIYHGRRTCKARKPLCGECCLNVACPSAFKA